MVVVSEPLNGIEYNPDRIEHHLGSVNDGLRHLSNRTDTMG